MIRALFLGVALFAFSVAAVGCGDDDDGNNGDGEPIATATPGAEPTEPADGSPTASAGSPAAPARSPTAPLSSEVPQEVIDAVEAYVVAGGIQSFPAVDRIVAAAECTAAGQVCYDADASTFEAEAATVRVYPYASDDIQDVALSFDDGIWNVATHSAPGSTQ